MARKKALARVPAPPIDEQPTDDDYGDEDSDYDASDVSHSGSSSDSSADEFEEAPEPAPSAPSRFDRVSSADSFVGLRSRKVPQHRGYTESKITTNEFRYSYKRDTSAITHKQIISIESEKPFVIETAIMDIGPLKGRQVFIVEPLPPKHEIFRIFDLPAEVRQMILAYCVVSSKTLEVHHGSRPNRSFLLHPSYLESHRLCRINRQLRIEALPLFFGKNHFELESTDVALSYFKVHRPYLRYLEVIGVTRTWYLKSGTQLMKKYVRHMPRLKHILLGWLVSHKASILARSMLSWTTRKTPAELASHLVIVDCQHCLLNGEDTLLSNVNCKRQEVHQQLHKAIVDEYSRIRAQRC